MSEPKAPDLRHLTVIHQENIAHRGGCLLLPSRLDATDLAYLLTLITDRQPICLIQNDALPAQDVLDLVAAQGLETLTFSTDPSSAATLSATLTPPIEAGQWIIHLPASTATLNATVTTVPSTTLEVLLTARVPTQPLYVHHPRDTQLSITAATPPGTTLFAFGPLLPVDRLSLPAYQESLFLLATTCFSQSPTLDISLPYALIKGFKKHGTKTEILDGKDERSLPFGKVFAAAIALSQVIKKETQKARVCIVLPPGIGGLIANVAVLLAGKIPVNLNFTASHASILSAMKQSEADRYLSADIFVRKMQAFPWPPSRQLILIERLLPTLKSQHRQVALLSKLLPTSLLATLLRRQQKGR
jgi:acyl-[acyl-carrier-protein]-phospholipid O-acyltransferase / long-chain-fatty-acid--[acyl-carrier-protein] ligase